MDTIIILCMIAGAILIGASFFIRENSSGNKVIGS